MFIEKILYFSEEDGEADVVVSDGQYMVRCYMYPIKQIKPEDQVSHIYGYCCKNIIRAEERKNEIKKLQEYYAYRIIGKLLNKKKKLVRTGNLYFELDGSIPNDIANGDYIEAFILRFDCTME